MEMCFLDHHKKPIVIHNDVDVDSVGHGGAGGTSATGLYAPMNTRDYLFVGLVVLAAVMGSIVSKDHIKSLSK